MGAMTREEILDLIGDPEVFEREQEEFRENAQALSSKRQDLIARYPMRWIAVYGGDVAVDAATLPELIAAMDERGLPRGHVVVRYIDKNPRKLIL